MVGKGRKHSAAPSSSAGDGMGTSIPASPLRRVLLSTMQGAAPVRAGRPPAKPRGTKCIRCIHVGIYVVLMLYSYWYFITHVGIYVVLKVHVAAGEVGRWLPRLLRWRLHGLHQIGRAHV